MGTQEVSIKVAELVNLTNSSSWTVICSVYINAYSLYSFDTDIERSHSYWEITSFVSIMQIETDVWICIYYQYNYKSYMKVCELLLCIHWINSFFTLHLILDLLKRVIILLRKIHILS